MKYYNSFLKLKKNGFKGENGTILILGGSKQYTGAPIFSALGALRSGSDLVYIMTDIEAISTIKSLHEAIVMKFEVNQRILDKITCCIIGPGLGRITDEELALILKIAEYLNNRDIPFIIDADGIHYYKKGIFSFLKIVILTPNIKESKELDVLDTHCCIFKGKKDEILYRNDKKKVKDKSSLKRCGGQGDILTGILSTAVSIDKGSIINASISSCKLLRKATSHSFEKNGFSMITSDIFKSLRKVLKRISNKFI